VKNNTHIKIVIVVVGLLFASDFCIAQQQILTQGGITMYSDRPLYIITAHVVNKRSNQPVAGVRGYLSVPNINFEFASALSDSTGQLKFLLKHLDHASSLLFQTDPDIANDLHVEPDDPFAGKNFADYFAGDTIPFYGVPDKRYLLDDYTRFPTMEEVLVEYVPEVKLMKSRNEVHFEVMNIPYKNYFESNPLVLLDGVPVFDLKKLMALDPLKIKKLDVIARKYYYGSLSCNGIVSFTSYEGDLAGYEPGENATVATYHK
jgi:hypothetical protein